MVSENTGLETLQDIRKMMERSSRFISLSGWSGVAAGTSALAGAFFARKAIADYYHNYDAGGAGCADCLAQTLIRIAVIVFITALVSAFLFTWFRSRREGVAFWGSAARRLLWNTAIPMAAGGVLVLRLISLKMYLLIGPVSMIFYGLALINGSRYTLGEVRYLGYSFLILGLISTWFPGETLYFWAFSFGILHIIYGISMWWKYERIPVRVIS
ncbi:hypothetical protein [Flavihumibacter petaseus]|uniref:Uncharacterized protein n=1 Tax=Flavihumibacter petaseus NBRC 106054 TaxID=1220578 RepID=A0A0E9MVT9_9BACT|nr:hypothetical protein [Flavihumibacter petaseus]GAO41704.1 hypothetical protein FPE01S_01_07180 [Flavihumibacter petaseus NBRC 106054]